MPAANFPLLMSIANQRVPGSGRFAFLGGFTSNSLVRKILIAIGEQPKPIEFKSCPWT